MNVKRLLSLLFALALATSLSFAQSTSSDQSSTDQSTTTTKKSRKSKLKSDAKEAGSATADTAKDVGSATAEGTKKAARKTKNAVTGDNSSSSKKIDLNSATKDELATLPGVGDATAQKIVDGRPYRAKNELVSKNVVTQSQYEQIKDQVIAHRAKTSASASSDNAAASGSVSSSTGTSKKSTKPATPK